MSEYLLNVIVLAELFILSLIDVRHKYVNIPIVMFGCMSVIIVRVLYHLDFRDVFTGVIVGFLVLAAAKLTDQAIGYGDGIVLMFIGSALGFSKVLTIFIIGLFLVSVAGLFFIALGRANRKSQWPMIPWLLVSFVIGVGIW